jgi:HlyD family secretion protein
MFSLRGSAMLLKYGLPIAAAICLAFAVYHVVRTAGEPLPLPGNVTAPGSPALAVTGIIEARTGNIAVASPVPGIVAQVMVEVGQHVSAGAPLFRLDDRSLLAELRIREAKLSAAQAQLARLEQMPRADEVASSAAGIGEARAHLATQQAKLDRGQQLHKDKLISLHEVEQLKQAVVAAQEQLARIQANDRLLRAGAWEADKAIARSAVAEAEALVAQGKTELNKLTVCAPVEATVLQVNVHAGEGIGVGSPRPPVVLGQLRPLRLRVDIPESLIPRFRSSDPARAVPRGLSSASIPLRFVRVEPLVVPRRALVGISGEQSDARVLPVIYEFDADQQAVYVGQQVDVFIGTASTSEPLP